MKPIADKIRAGYPGLYLVTHEETRAEAMLHALAQDLEYQLFVWSCLDGLVHVTGDAHITDCVEADEVLDHVSGLPPKSLIVLRDFHRHLQPGAEPGTIRRLKDALLCANKAVDGVDQCKTVIILGAELHLPVEVERLVTVVEFALPDRGELATLLENFCASTGTKTPKGAARDALLDAAGGLSTTEFEDALALSLVESKKLLPAIISREKAASAKKNGLLEVIESPLDLKDIGGLDPLKAELRLNSRSFSQAARDYGLPSPRHMLILGQGGTGKSLCARACGNIFGVILLRLEAGNLFGGHVGDTERNWRTVFAMARANRPCGLWIDEADGLFPRFGQGGGDGGTTNRVVKAIMQDMQFNSDGIIFIFTANDIDGFPDALIDRMDVWSVDLPTTAERAAIWQIQIAKTKRLPEKFDITRLATLTEGFSGRQIEGAWIKAMNIAFNDDAREPVMADLETVLKSFVPTSVTMKDSIEARRKRLSGKARPASLPEVARPASTSGRRLAA